VIKNSLINFLVITVNFFVKKKSQPPSLWRLCNCIN